MLVTGRETEDGLRAETERWSALRMYLFRFGFLYLALTCSYWILVFADRTTAVLGRFFNALWRPLVLLVARYGFGIRERIEPNFVLDTRYLYMLLLCFLIVSAVGAWLWSYLDRGRRNYATLHDWLRVLVRYSLVYLMLHYGLDKIFLTQFPSPGLARLTERFGDYSPSSLMWAFIGSSRLFTIFGGVAEVTGALLLLSRRTTTLGALITFAVMFNVMVMDLSYDVTVKLLCFHILLMAALLVLPELRRLLDFFVLNRPVGPARAERIRVRGLSPKAWMVLKAALICFLIVPLTLREFKSYRTSGAGAPRPALYGLYEVGELSLAGVEKPPLLTDGGRWRYLIFDKPEVLAIEHIDGSLSNYRMSYDPVQRAVRVSVPGQAADGSVLRLSSVDGKMTGVEGTWAGEPIRATLRPLDRSSFTLVNRGFHWISESIFVR